MSKLRIITIAVISVIVTAVLILRGSYGNEEIERANFAIQGLKNGIALEAGAEIGDIYVTVPTDMKPSNVISVSSDQNVAYLRLEKNDADVNGLVLAKVIGVSEGIAEIYVRSADGKILSEKYKINVIAAENVITESVSYETEETVIENAVYVTPTGTKYHLRKSCAGKSARATDLESAVENGYEPCKSCAMK